MRTQLLLFSVYIISALCINSDTFFGNYTHLLESSNKFSKFYLSNGKAVLFNVTKEDVYFPKCCPIGYMYESVHHKCVQNDQSTPIYDYLDLQVNLISSGLENCEVIVDHVISDSDFKRKIRFLNTTLVFQQTNYFNIDKYCLDRELLSEDVLLRLCYNKNYCTKPEAKNKKCFKKCCPDGYHYYGYRCQLNPTLGLDLLAHADVINNARDEFAIWHEGYRCPRYKASKEKYNFFLESNGHFFVQELGEMKEYKIHESMYCVEAQDTQNSTDLIFVLCTVSNVNNDIQFLISRIAMIISLIFLLLTIIMYFFRPNIILLDKIIISYCFVMFGAYLFLTLVQFEIGVGSCEFMGYATLFFFTATFAWMNVLSYHIWKTFGLRGSCNKIFLKYNLYAWAVPIILTILVLVINLYLPLPEHLHPFLAESQCVLENRISDGNYGYLIFFVIPSGMSIVFNSVLFIMCLCLLFKKHEESEQECQRAPKKKILKVDRQQLFFGLKLFLIMGISWSFEIISSVINFRTNYFFQTIGILGDTLNGLQGFLIFLIFTYPFITRTINRHCQRNRKNVEEDSIQQDISNGEGREMTAYNAKTDTT